MTSTTCYTQIMEDTMSDMAETRKDRAGMIFERIKNRLSWLNGDFEQQEETVWDVILNSRMMLDAFNDYRFSSANPHVRVNFDDLMSDLLDLEERGS